MGSNMGQKIYSRLCYVVTLCYYYVVTNLGIKSKVLIVVGFEALFILFAKSGQNHDKLFAGFWVIIFFHF